MTVEESRTDTVDILCLAFKIPFWAFCAGLRYPLIGPGDCEPRQEEEMTARALPTAAAKHS